MRLRFFLLLLLLPLCGPVFGQAAPPAPDDLVVTAEIVGYSKWAYAGKKYDMLHAKMVVRNTTNHPREISMMSCDWPESWVASGARGFFEPTYQPSCDKNTPAIVTIPAGEAVVFKCPLFGINAYAGNPEDLNGVISFKLGFIDLTSQDVWDGFYGIPQKERIQAKIQKARAVYWSNVITNKIDINAVEKLLGDDRYLSYSLAWNGK